MSRLNERADVEASFTKCLAVLDFAPTKVILDALYEAVLAGVKTDDILKTLLSMTLVQRISK